ncbi:uncharacterized protein LOC112088538 [Eutrema salsugineum]|uniref:uncharacterized protein LOC112088538 n=1 Tax=Eutrema salsugineum TaxID=72664 RepID=UPI000CED2BC9|nr:uncharacterized protein LOC112088538 [Eutrema salsugineum]
MRGIPVDDINEAIGSSVEKISSILEADSDEEDLLAQIGDSGFDDGIRFIDIIVEGWIDHLTKKKKKIVWRELYEVDIVSRVQVPPEKPREDEPISVAELKASVVELKASMENNFKEIVEKVKGMDTRVKTLEAMVLPS